jgi:hypothetical protein
MQDTWICDYEVGTASNRGQKLTAIRRLGFRNSIIQFKSFSEKIFYLLLYFSWLLNQIFRGSSFNRKDSQKLWSLICCSPCWLRASKNFIWPQTLAGIDRRVKGCYLRVTWFFQQLIFPIFFAAVSRLYLWNYLYVCHICFNIWLRLFYFIIAISKFSLFSLNSILFCISIFYLRFIINSLPGNNF